MFIYIKWICILINYKSICSSLLLNAVVIKDGGSEWGGILYYILTKLKYYNNYAVIYNCNEYLWKQNIYFYIYWHQ